MNEHAYGRLRKYYIALAGGVYVFALVMTAMIVFKNMADNRNAKQEELVHSARLFREHVDRIFGNVDWIMETARNSFLEAPSDKEKLEKTLVALGQREEFAYFVTIVGTDGKSVASSLGTSDVDLTTRPHVRALMEHDAPSLYISEPLVGQRSGAMAINISKKVFDDNGEWRGILIVSFDPSRIATFLKSLSINETGVATLLRADGAVLARSTQIDGGAQRFDPELFGSAVNGRQAGQFTLASPIDGVQRLFAFHRLTRLPLIVVVGLDYDYFDRERTQWLLLSVLWMGLLGAALIGIGYLIRKFVLTEERRHAQQLAEAERLHTAELVESAFNSTGVFVVVFDKQLTVLFANQPARDLIESLSSPVDGLLRALQQSDRTPVAHISPATTHWVRLRDESMRTICWSVASAEWVGPDCLACIGFDRTEAEHMERMLSQKARLTALGEISVGIAHEVAQPLTIINFTSRRMERSLASPDVQMEGLATIKSAATRAGRILGQIKTFAKQYEHVEGAIFDVADCVEAIELLMRRQLDDRGIALRIEQTTQPVYSRGDPHLLEQILLNLVLNARDALRARDPAANDQACISIDWRAEEAKVHIRVADNGPGIPPEHQPRVFEPFFTTKKGGTGLGLSLSFSMARQMGGALSLDPAAKGGVFLIDLPLAKPADDEEAEAGHAASAAE
ncbi:MAG: ATP-binding protein [Beijerinckiaceae bacterium]|nr:ATP-binding protein [Beijerinckiaceae bacterium]